ncbi:MAG: glycoside hydrolase family 11 protein [Ruminococcus sp.]|nr:glycoside hydrolase family 11 protein [Ruminococcus sp.]
MKHKFLRKSTAGILTGLMCLTSVPVIPSAVFSTAYAASAGQTLSVGNGRNQHKEDNVDGYSYEIWLDNTGGSGSMTLGSGGSFNTEWSAQVSQGNFLARRGRNYDASKKATQYGPIVMNYAAEYSASSQGNSRLCVYGWFKDPLVEYYIIEDWVNWCPSAQGGAQTITVDGAEYEIFQLDHTGPTILGDTRTFKQYFSVRKQKRTSGTITVSDHFAAWEKAGWNIGNLTEVALNVEGWESSGKANVSKLTIGTEGGGQQDTTPVTTQPVQQGNTDNGQGWTMPGNGDNGQGFDWSNFDWSSFQMPGNGDNGQGWQNPGNGDNGQGWQNPGNGDNGQGWTFPGMGDNGQGWTFPGMGDNGQGWQNPGGNDNGQNPGWQPGMANGFNDTNNNIGDDAGNGGNANSGLNAKIKNDMPTKVPAGAEQSGGCKVEKKTYTCKFTGGQKSCNVILPPNYNPSKQYPVMYVLHGIGGDESSMVSGMGVQELLAGLIAKGEAEEMIIVLPSQYTSKNPAAGGGFGINQEVCAAYDNFLYDISDSLIDFIEQNYSVKPGRENRAITGFSMGGREAIYCGIMRPDLFGYVGGACPAPGITPAKDMFMTHPGCMTESELKFRDVGPEPYVFMITGGTNDSVVGDFPKQYSDIFTKNGVDHVYQSIPGGGHGADSVKPHLYTFMRYAFKGSSESTPATTTTVTTTSTTTSTTTTTTTAPAPVVTTTSDNGFAGGPSINGERAAIWGDANCDDNTDMSDAVLIMQSLANPNGYKITERGKINGDVYENGSGITNQDAVSIQKYLVGMISKLPESFK